MEIPIDGYAVIDVETGGLDPHKHPLIEVAYVLEDGREVAYSLPFYPNQCDARALGVNGWGKRPFAPVIGYMDAIDTMRVDFSRRLLVSSPATFDMGFIGAFWRTYARGEEPPWHHASIIDLKSYACGVFRTFEPLRNSDIAARTGVVDDSDHTALADARYTCRMFEALRAISDRDRRSIRTMRSISQMLEGRS